jgi:hypothetical protein
MQKIILATLVIAALAPIDSPADDCPFSANPTPSLSEWPLIAR